MKGFTDVLKFPNLLTLSKREITGGRPDLIRSALSKGALELRDGRSQRSRDDFLLALKKQTAMIWRVMCQGKLRSL